MQYIACRFPRRPSLNHLYLIAGPSISLSLSHRTVPKAMLIALVAIALRSYANGCEAVGRAIEATKGLCCGETMPSSGFGQGWGGGSGGAMGKAAAADGFAVPLLHPGQVGGGGKVNVLLTVSVDSSDFVGSLSLSLV